MPYDLATSQLTTYSKKMKLVYGGDSFTPIFIVALFTVAKFQNQPKCSTVHE